MRVGRGRTSPARVLAIATVLAAMSWAFLGVMPSNAGNDPPLPAGLAGSGWIPDVSVAGGPNAMYAPSMTTGRNGQLFVAFTSLSLDPSGDVMFTSSTDSGLSWSPAVTVAGGGNAQTTPTIGVDPSTGRIYVAYLTEGPRELAVAWSDDGVNWNPVSVFACQAGSYESCHIPHIAVEYWNAASNRVYVSTRATISGNPNDVDLLVFRSEDDGTSWSQMFAEGFSTTAPMDEPILAVQRGTDLIDRVILAYKTGAAWGSLTNVVLRWSQDHGSLWMGPTTWSTSSAQNLGLAAAPDGSSVLVTTGSGTDVYWYLDNDTSDLAWGTGTSNGTWAGFGDGAHISRDGVGSESTASAGYYHIAAFDFPAIRYRWATANLSAVGPIETVTDTGAVGTSGYSDVSITTMFRGDAWHPGVAWTDLRTTVDGVWYSTPGAFITFDTNPSGFPMNVNAIAIQVPYTQLFLSGDQVAVNVQPEIPVSTGTRWGFSDWSNGGPRAQTFFASNANETLTANYVMEHFLGIVTEHGNATTAGEGWYENDTTASIAMPAEVTEDGTTWEFTGWSGDHNASDRQTGVLMDRPKTVTANWRVKPAITESPWVWVGIGLLLVLLLFALILLLRRRRKREATEPPSPPPPESPKSP